VPYLLTCDNLVIERLLFVIELDQDILRQALAEDQEDITTVVRKNSGGFSINPIATEPSSILVGLLKMHSLYMD
jgi:hypothetical protein